VVGKPARRPVFSADMLFVIFHPSWGSRRHEDRTSLAAAQERRRRWFFSSARGAQGRFIVRKAAGDPNSINWAAPTSQLRFTQPPGPRTCSASSSSATSTTSTCTHAERTFEVHGCAFRRLHARGAVRLAEVLLATTRAGDGQRRIRRGGRSSSPRPFPCISPTLRPGSTTTAAAAADAHMSRCSP
jgi:hypothetical protein